MTLTKRPILPVIKIYKYPDDGSYHEFNPFTPTFNFRLLHAQIKPSFDNTGGEFFCTITSSDGTNSAALTLLNTVKAGNPIMFSIGKTSSTEDILFGLIESIEIEEPSRALMRLSLHGLDAGTTITMGRVGTLYREQQKDTDGKTPLASDTSTNLKNLFFAALGLNPDGTSGAKDALIIDQLNASTGVVRVCDQDYLLSFPLDQSNIIDTGRSVPVFSASGQRIKAILDDIDALGNTIHYFTPDKKLVYVPAGTPPPNATETLITDNPSDSLINAPYTNYGLIMQNPAPTITYTLEEHRVRLYGFDDGSGQTDTTTSKETNSSSQTITTSYYAQKFTPLYRNCSAIALYISRSSTVPTPPFAFELVEDLSGNPSGSLIASGQKPGGSISNTLGWHYFPVNKNLNTGKAHWIVVYPPNDGSNSYSWGKDAAATGTNASSTDGATWTVNTSSFNFNFRIDFTDASIYEWHGYGSAPTSTTRHFWEDVVKNPTLYNQNTMRQYIQSQFEKSSKQKIIFKCSVYCPDTALKPGQLVYVSKTQSGQTLTGFFTVGNIEYVFEGGDFGATGNFFVNLTLTQFATYP